MATRPAKHPTADALKAFGLGKLDDSSSGALLAHLDLCVDCRKIVASQSGDDFLDRIRQAHSRNATPAPPKSLGGMEGKPKPPPGPTTLFNLPPELADNPSYEILRELGRGGMGVVYLAKNKLMDRLEVLKVINKALLDRPGAVERFLREIRSAAKLNHVNVVAAYSAVQQGSLLAFAMEYIEGEDLASVVKSQGPLPIAHACFYVQQAARGLQHAFEKHMVHRDIKPQNLILAREGKKHIVKVLDFGLAKATSEKRDDLGLTGEGRMLGTPDYIAPEQSLDAARADIRADIYSLGCTLYFLLSGRPPFRATSLSAMLLAQQMQEAESLNLVRPEIPEELAAVVRKMMAKTPSKRYQTPLEVVQALAPFVKQGAVPKSSPELSMGTAKAAAVKVVKTEVPPVPSAPATQLPPRSESPPPVAWDSLTDGIIAAPKPQSGLIRQRRSTAVQPGSWKAWLMGGGVAAGLLLLGLLGYWLATILLRVETANGTLLVEMNDDEVEARIKNGKLILSGPDGKVRYTLTANDRSKKLEAGAYKIRVEGADGLVLDTPEFTLKKGGQVKVRVTLERKAVAKNDRINEKWVSLFNGKDLTGWKTHPKQPGNWRVEKGVLIGSGPADSYLYTDRGDYKDFRLRVETRINDGGNSGVCFRSLFGPGFPTDNPRFLLGYEAQINCTHTDGFKTGSLYAIPGGVLVSVREAPVPPGQWFTLEVIAEGDHIVIKVNGKTTVDYTDEKRQYTSGHIALQQFEPRTVAEFRKIEVKSLEETPVAADAAWVKQVGAMSTAKQLEAVSARLKELNPGFDGNLKPKIEGGVITELRLTADKVKDISPVRALAGLRTLDCSGSTEFANGRLADLLPLKDMNLTSLNCNFTQVSDLAPLKDMKLTSLSCWRTSVADLFPLKDMPLTFLDCDSTQVSDLSPLKGMKLTYLAFCETHVSDLSALKGMPLTELYCKATQVSDLSPLKGMPLTFLHCGQNSQISDLSPLKDMKLTGLACYQTKVSDLSSLKDMKLTRLSCYAANVSDLSLLKGMPLKEIWCDFKPERDAEILHSIKTLEKINGKSAADFWKDVEANQAKVVPTPAPSKELEALRRDQIAPEALKMAGDGDPKRAPASLVGVLGEAQPIHSQAVLGLAYSPDGRWLASGSADRTIMLRDTASGKVKRILQGHTKAVSTVGFSKDGHTLVSAGHDGTLRLWPVDKDEKPTIIETKLGQPVIWAMAISPDGRFVAAAGNSGLIKLWKWGVWEKPIEIADLRGKVTIRALAFSPDGELLACGGSEEKEDAQVRIYATADGKQKKLPNNTTRVTGLSFSHDGKYLAAVRLAALKLPGGDGRVWEVATGKTVTKLSRGTFPGEWNDSCGVAWSPDDKTLAVGTIWRVIVYDFPTGARRTLWFGLDQGVSSVSFSPHGDMLAAGGSRDDMPVWDTASWKLKYLECGHPRHVRSLAISPDGRELLSLGNEMAVLRWQLARPEKAVVHHLDFGSDIQPYLHSVAYGRDGKTCIVPGSQLIAVRNTVTEKETVIRTLPLGLDLPAVSPDGRIVAAGARDGYLHLWDIALGRDVHRFPAKGRWCGLAFSRDGVFLASCNAATKRVMIWNTATGAEGCSWEVKSLASTSAFHPQGKTLATGHEDGSILLWDSATGQKKQALAGHAGPVRSLKFTPDGKNLVSSGNDGIIRLWNPEQPRAREIIPLGPANRPLTFDLDPSGKYLFAAGHTPVIFILRLP